MSASNPSDETREQFRHFVNVPTRWMDLDPFGHVNQAAYYTYFDVVIITHLERCGIDQSRGREGFFCVESGCRYHRELIFPQTVEAGLRVAKLGNSSVRYEIGLFTSGQVAPAATGHYVHVFVDPQTRRPTTLPASLRTALERLQ